MHLTVVLLNWHDEQQTLRCAEAVRSWQTLAPSLVVVDNQSTEASRSVLTAALSPAAVISSPVNLGFAGGNNLGIKRALDEASEFILLLNTDAEIAEAGVSALLTRLQANPHIAIIGPVIDERAKGRSQRLIGGRDIARHANTRIRATMADLSGLAGYPLPEVDYVSGTVLLGRACVFRRVGMLDEAYFFSGEIADFCKRVRDSGQRVCVDLDVAARHDTTQTPERLRQTLYVYYSLRNRFLYVRKHHAGERMRYLAYWIGFGALELMRSIKARKLGKARAIMLALAHGLINRYGDQNARFL
jgi:GT2 family glycosyltransferase